MGFNFCSCVHFAIYATVLSFFISLLNICHVAVLLISLFNAANRQTPHPKRKKLQFSLVCVWSYTLIHTSSKNHFFKFHLPFLSIFLPWFFFISMWICFLYYLNQSREVFYGFYIFVQDRIVLSRGP